MPNGARLRYAFWAFRVDNRELDKEMVKLIMKESKRWKLTKK